MPDLSPTARAVTERAHELIGATLDGLRNDLLIASGDVRVEAKADGTPVTDADRAVDDRLGDAIAATFPDHGVLSEERETRSPDTEWTWIVDPIDGTSNFTCQLPYWCISVALALDGEPVLGVIDAPVLGRRYSSIVGGGAWLEGRASSLDGREQRRTRHELRVRAPVDWRDGRYGHVPVMMTTSTARYARGAGLRLNPRVMGSTALDLAVVAQGVAAASVAVTPKVWDIAAGALLVREAGGAVVTIGSDPLLPITRGVEHANRAAITAAGPDEAYVRGLADALLESRAAGSTR